MKLRGVVIQLTYPDEFVERVKSEYSNQEAVCHAAEYNEYELGQYLILGLKQSKSDRETSERRRNLHKDWISMVCTAIESSDKNH
jgi:hypothetical protein